MKTRFFVSGLILSVGIPTSFLPVSAANTDSEYVAEAQEITPQNLVFSQILAIGPIQSLDFANSKIYVLAEGYTVSNIFDFMPGQVVAVGGFHVLGQPSIVNSVTKLGSTYVPGATRVFTSGIISAINRSTGRLRVGNLKVNYTNLLASVDQSVWTPQSMS